jgi:DNA-binding CsgD family transcriptional regulator
MVMEFVHRMDGRPVRDRQGSRPLRTIRHRSDGTAGRRRLASADCAGPATSRGTEDSLWSSRALALRALADDVCAQSEDAWRAAAAAGLLEESMEPDSIRRLLSPQELAVARLAAAGLSNREIGQRLFLSPRTVSTHLYRIFPKLEIRSRAQLGSLLRLG